MAKQVDNVKPSEPRIAGAGQPTHGLRHLVYGATAVAVTLTLAWWAQAYNYLLFHSIAESVCVAIGGGAFFVAWNARRFHGSRWILLLGTALLAVAAMDLVHMLAYKGMNVFGDRTADPATQLWVASRYLFAISLLGAALLVPSAQRLSDAEERVRAQAIELGRFAVGLLAGYGIVTAMLIASVLVFDIFPVCFDEQTGLTPFKKISEYVICGLLIVAGAIFLRRWRRLDERFLQLLLMALVMSVLAEVCFTLYQDVYGLLNWGGHLFKLASYGLIYGAIIVTGMQRPFGLLFRDLKEREAALVAATAKAEAASRAKDRFLAVLSHELRNPLNPVLAQVSALQVRDDLLPDVAESLGVIRRNVELEARLIDDLLDLTRIAKGRLTLEKRPMDVHLLVGEALAITNDDVAAKKLTVDVSLQADRHTVDGDPARLLQVLWNVLKNAVKFSPIGGRVHVESRQVGSGESARLQLSVADEGIGIDAQQMDQIFQAFQQADESIGQEFGGLGLGLSISHMLLKLHGGTIRAESEGPGHGARFLIELPLMEVPILPSPTPNRPSPRRKATARETETPSLRLLLVEDHLDTARIMARLLEALGHQVSVAHTVADGLAAAEREPFDLVLSDLGLPDGTGHDLMRRLHRRHGLRGICLSGYGMDEDVERSRDAGFFRHLTKPVSFEQLSEALAEATVDTADTADEEEPVAAG